MSKEPEVVFSQPVIARFERTHGSTTVKTTVYGLPGNTPEQEAKRVDDAEVACAYRAEQLEPVKPKRERIERDPVMFDTRDPEAFGAKRVGKRGLVFA
jgi:hypothetical protein